MSEPEKVYNIYTRRMENCYVGEGCNRHMHQLSKQKFSEAKDILENQEYNSAAPEFTRIGMLAGTLIGGGSAMLFAAGAVLPILGLVFGGFALGGALGRATGSVLGAGRMAHNWLESKDC
jgi:hypothetical protein